MTPKKNRLPAELGRAIPFRDVLAECRSLGVSTDEAVLRLRVKKVHLLLRHYGLDASMKNLWPVLALKLAVDFVPGLRVTLPPGRPSKVQYPVNGIPLAEGRPAPKKAPGRPPSGTWYGRGRQLLLVLKYGKSLATQISNEEALYRAYRKELLPEKHSDGELKGWAKADAKRVSDAKKTLRKRR